MVPDNVMLPDVVRLAPVMKLKALLLAPVLVPDSENDPPPLLVKEFDPNSATPSPDAEVPLMLTFPELMIVALVRVMPFVVSVVLAVAVRLPPPVLIVAPVTLTERPAVSVNPPPLVVMLALTSISSAELSVRLLPLFQVSALATVMSPFCPPAPPPVLTVTLAVESAFCSVVTDSTESLPFGVNGVPPDMLLSAPLEIVTS